MKVGDKVPEFKLMAYHNDELREFSSKEMEGKWWVLFFYPADFTFVCPTELGDLADHYDKFKELNVEILSISTDTHWVHKAWHDESETIAKIQFPMLADPTGKVSKDFNVYIDSDGVALRGTFIINPEGTLVAMEVHSDGIGRSVKELIRKIQAAQYVEKNGVVCPSGWEPGDEVLVPGLNLVGKI